MTDSEKTIEQYLKSQMKEIGGLCIKITSPSTRGLPDRLLVHDHFGMMLVELKAASGKLSPHQIDMIDKVYQSGGQVLVLSSKAAVDTFVSGILACDDCCGLERLDS